MTIINLKNYLKRRNVDCYIFNTGFFLDKKVPKEVTLNSLELIVEGKVKFKPWGEAFLI